MDLPFITHMSLDSLRFFNSSLSQFFVSINMICNAHQGSSYAHKESDPEDCNRSYIWHQFTQKHVRCSSSEQEPLK